MWKISGGGGAAYVPRPARNLLRRDAPWGSPARGTGRWSGRADQISERRKKAKQTKSPASQWWGKVDSNHRSRRQQIYSLPHLTALEFPHIHLELVDGFEPPTC